MKKSKVKKVPKKVKVKKPNKADIQKIVDDYIKKIEEI